MMTLKNARVLWLVGLGIEIGYGLDLMIYHKLPNLFIPMPENFAIWIIYTILILIAMKIISDFADDRKIFYYSVTIFVIDLIMSLIDTPIAHFILRTHPTSHQKMLAILQKDLLFESISSWVVIIITAILYFLVLYKIYIFLKDIRFKISGIIYLIATGVSLVLGYIVFVMTWRSYASPKFFGNVNIPPKVSYPFLITADLLSYAALVVLIIAIIQMNTETNQ